jgi:hypothetical protein
MDMGHVDAFNERAKAGLPIVVECEWIRPTSQSWEDEHGHRYWAPERHAFRIVSEQSVPGRGPRPDFLGIQAGLAWQESRPLQSQVRTVPAPIQTGCVFVAGRCLRTGRREIWRP